MHLWLLTLMIPTFIVGFQVTVQYLPTPNNLPFTREHVTFENASFSPQTALTRMEERNSTNQPVTTLSWGIADDIQTVPESIGTLTQLSSLTIQNQPVHALPESIGKLNKLKTLHIINTPLTSLPESLGNLAALEDLKIVGTNIRALPPSIQNLSQLRLLTLSHNRLSALPPLSPLTNLVELDLTDNALARIPADLPISLKFIYLGKNKIPLGDLISFDRTGTVPGIYY
jgi:Leucine-rich repeat (LRR) protein